MSAHDLAAAVRAAHPVTTTARCGNRLAEPADPPPGPPAPPVWCHLAADGHDPEFCRTWDGYRLASFVRGSLSIDVRPPVVTHRCGTCSTPQDPHSLTPCATLAAVATHHPGARP